MPSLHTAIDPVKNLVVLGGLYSSSSFMKRKPHAKAVASASSFVVYKVYDTFHEGMLYST